MSKPVQLPSGSWRIQWKTVDGKRKGETFKTYDAARAALRRHEVDLDDIKAKRKDPSGAAIFRDVAIEFLASRKKGGDDPRRTKRRLDAYQSHLDHHLLPIVGALPLEEITGLVVKKLLQHLADRKTARPGEKNEAGRTLGSSTIRNILTTFRQVMAYGNRPITIKLPKELRQDKRKAKRRPKYIKTPLEIVRYLDACQPEWFRIASALAIYGGLRRGEVASLRWKHIDTKAGRIRIELSWEGPTKSGEPRTVPLPAELAEYLKRWRMKTGGKAEDRVVLVSGKAMEEKNNPCAPLTKRACGRAGIEPLGFHSLRATFASHAADAGVPISKLRALMGHTDIATTAIYIRTESELAAQDERAHLSFGGADATVIALDRASS